jgi:hypothetical protein
MTYRLTRESARAAGACYSDARVAALVPPEGLAPTEVAALDIPLEDRVWALLCGCDVSRDSVVAFARLCEDRAAAFAAAAFAAAAIISADRAVGGGADAAYAAAVASAAAYAAYTAAECVPRATARAGRTAAFGAAVSAARAALESAAAAALAEGSDAAAAEDVGYCAEQQWQVNTLVELLSHNHPQIEG